MNLEQVKSEISQLIELYPERRGSVDGVENGDCVYYLNGDGVPIGYTMVDSTQFTTPICIVGQWVETFHPELKEDPVFSTILRKNAALLDTDETNLDEEIHIFLAHVQTQQDDGKPWGEITL